MPLQHGVDAWQLSWSIGGTWLIRTAVNQFVHNIEQSLARVENSIAKDNVFIYPVETYFKFLRKLMRKGDILLMRKGDILLMRKGDILLMIVLSSSTNDKL